MSDPSPSFYASPAEATAAPAEEFLYVACLHEGTGVDEPDFLAVVDAEDGRIVHRLPMPNVGDELHHFGWNRCSSACHGPDRSHLIVPGFRSSRIHVVNVADDPRRPQIEKVIEPEELVRATGLTRPHTVHCMPGENIVISMLGDADGNGACGFAVLDARTFEIKGRWENGGPHPQLNYDFWYQPRQNVLASSEFGEPTAYEGGFDPDDVAAGRYGSRLHFWNLSERRVEQTLELGEAGLVPLEIRWLHDPDADEGFVGAALSSTMWHFHRDNGAYSADQVIAVDGVEQEGWPFPVPGLITDLVVSMDDRFLYFSNWLHGDLRQYDISDPANPRDDRPAPARRRPRPAVRRRPRPQRRPADAPALARRAPPLRHQLAVLDVGQPVLSRPALLAAARELRPRRRHGARPRTSSSSSTRRARTRSASRAATARRRSSNDARPHRRPPGRGERADARSGRGDHDPLSDYMAKAPVALRQTEEAFLDAAERLLVSVGHAGITTRALAEEAGANHGLVHYYFGSMENLLARVLERFTDRLIGRQRAMYAAPDVPFAEKWRTAMRYLDADREYQKVWFELQALAWNRPELRERVAHVDAEWRAVLSDALARAARALRHRHAAPPRWCRW